MIINLEKQMGQVASSVEKLKAQVSRNLPSQTLDPKKNVNAITLWSRKKLEEQRSKKIEIEKEYEIETKLSIKKKQPTPPYTETTTNIPKVSPNSMNSSFKKILSFPLNSSKSKKEDK